MVDYSFNRGGNLNSAIPNPVKISPTGVKPINTAFWGNINRGGGLTSAIPKQTIANTASKIGTGALSKVATGLKVLTGPIGAGLAVAGQILKAKEANAGEDEKLRELGILPPLPNKKANVAPWIAHPEDWSQVKEPNSITPIPPLDTRGSMLVDGNRINYEDIGNPLKDAALINSKGYSFSVAPSETSIPQNEGGTDLNNLLKTIQSIQPVQSYTNRVSALNTGNTTWDMNGLDKILAAKAEQQADQERYAHQVGALANLGTAQMNAEATKIGHQLGLLTEQERSKYLAPYHEALGAEALAKAKSAPLTAIADLIKDQQARSLTNKDRLEQAVKVLTQFGPAIPTDPSDPGYEIYHNAKDTFDYLTSKGK